MAKQSLRVDHLDEWVAQTALIADISCTWRPCPSRRTKRCTRMFDASPVESGSRRRSRGSGRCAALTAATGTRRSTRSSSRSGRNAGRTSKTTFRRFLGTPRTHDRGPATYSRFRRRGAFSTSLRSGNATVATGAGVGSRIGAVGQRSEMSPGPLRQSTKRLVVSWD